MRCDVRDNRNKNWLWMRRELLREDGDELGPYGIAVYAALASYAGKDNTAYPSLSSVADMIGCSRRQVRREIKTLNRLDWIGYRERSDEQKGNTSHMFYLLSCPYDTQSEGCADSPKGSDSVSDKVERKEVSSSNSAGVREDDAVQAYQDVFPRRANHVQAEQIATKVDDLDLWRAVMRWWAANGHRAKSVGKMLNKYRQTDTPEDLYRDAPSGDGASGDPKIASKPDDPRSQIR